MSEDKDLEPPKLPIPKRESIPVSDFEGELFRDGTLDFNLDKYMARAREDLDRKKNWYEENPGWDARRTAESMARDYQGANYELIWRDRFSGRVPKRWDLWYFAMDDFKKAGQLGARLSQTLVDAGVSYPHHLVANETGKGQLLNTRQLAWLFVRPDLPLWNRNQIMEAQLKMGVKKEDIKHAMKLADEVRENLRKRQSGASSLENISKHPALSSPSESQQNS